MKLTELVAAWVPETYVNAAITAVFAPQPVPSGYLAHLGNDLTLRRTALAANVQQINTLRPQVVAMENRLTALTLPIALVPLAPLDGVVPGLALPGPVLPPAPRWPLGDAVAGATAALGGAGGAGVLQVSGIGIA